MTPPRHRQQRRRQPLPQPAKRGSKANKPYRMRVPQALWLVPLVLLIGFGGVLGFFAGEEMRTSQFQAEAFGEMTKDVSYRLAPGPFTAFHVPTSGPYNQRLGYSYLPFFFKALEGDDYEVSQQMRVSPQYQRLVDEGLYPLYRPKTEAGLVIKDRTDGSLYGASYPAHVFESFEDIPPLLVQTLLFVEDRNLLKPETPTQNPVIEWDRFFYAAIGQVLKHIVPGLNLGGGSTLATQIEKFRFSPGGQTNGPLEKMRQIISGSLRVYSEGQDTRPARRRIVLDYLNSTPLSARRGFGEINSIGDGFWAWFGLDLKDVKAALILPETNPDDLALKATVYREALGLILAQRRPTYYLLTERVALDALTDKMLALLVHKGVISPELYEATRVATFHFLPEAPNAERTDFLDEKAVNALRNKLLQLLGLRDLYELDRLDLTASSTLDAAVQTKMTDFMKKMSDPDHLRAIGLYGFRLLTPENDPLKIKWSFILYEKAKEGNLLRVQADNINSPLDMNEGVKLDLGSTAKLRTLVTYLEIVGELYRRYAGLSDEDLHALTEEAPDVLTSWATTWLREHPDATIDEMLGAAMARKYSASPAETFFTGGGAHVFVNFEKSEDSRIMDLHEALKDSVNLVFVRLMRDIVNYTISQGQQTKQEILSDPDHPARKAYLERYADREGQTFLNRYIGMYKGLSGEEILERITPRAHKGATSLAILFRSLYPGAPYESFAAYMKQHALASLDLARLPKLFQDYPADRYNLADRGYITGTNPLELWLASYLVAHPKASSRELLTVSKPVRLESYAWLFHKGKKGAQDTRIRILLELDAFARIQQRWARLGYPFDKLVPSFATAIGSSADRPFALAELMGIIMNDGIRKPMLRFKKLHFAEGTPYETTLEPDGDKAERVLDPAITRTVKAALSEVVEDGTARRLHGIYTDAKGQPLMVGGKTGTGDHRFDEYGPGHKLISSRVVNRTGTFVFYIGDRFFGTITAHVAGEDAAAYKFSSALTVQTLKSLAPLLQPLIAPPPAPEAAKPGDAPADEPAPAEQQAPAPVPAPAAEQKPKPKTAPKREAPTSSQELMMDILPQ